MKSIPAPVRPITFFALTYVLSWLIWIPLTLAHFGVGPLEIPEGTGNLVRLFGVLMPATAAMILVGRAGGRAGLRNLLGRLLIWRVGWWWWVVAAVLQPLMLVASGLLYNRLGGSPAVTPVEPVGTGAMVANIVFLALATLGEEIGWRGLALPALQERRRALTASVILGVLWAVWHIPFWLLLDTFDQFGVGYLVLNFLLIVPSTLYITWFFNHGRSSLLLAAAFHVTFNIVNTAWLPVTTSVGAFGLLIVLEWAIAILVFRHLEAAPVRMGRETAAAGRA